LLTLERKSRARFRATATIAVMSEPPKAFAALGRDPVVEALLAACGDTPCHLVGGVLRDRALGLATHDLDVTVAGRGSEIAQVLSRTLAARLVFLGGKEFAAFRLVLLPDAAGGDGADPDHGAGRDHGTAPEPAADTFTMVDIWDRQDMSLHDDLARRDLTINSIAWEPRRGATVDPFGGLADLDARVLRATTQHSFTGDPLRVLRLARLLQRLPGFTAQAATRELARAAAPHLGQVSAERIRDEIGLMLSHERADAALRALAELDVYPALWLGSPPAPRGGPPALPGGAAGDPAATVTHSDLALTAGERTAQEMAALPGCAHHLATCLAAAGVPTAAASPTSSLTADSSTAAASPTSSLAAGSSTAAASPTSSLAADVSTAGSSVAGSSVGASPTGSSSARSSSSSSPTAGLPPAAPACGTPPPGAQFLDAPTPAAWDAMDLTAARYAATFRYLPDPQPAGDRPAAGAAGVDAARSRQPGDAAAALDRMAAAGFVTARTAADVRSLLAMPAHLPMDRVGRRRFLHRHGRHWLTAAVSSGAAAAVRGDAAAARWRRAAAALCRVALRDGPALIAPPKLISGQDIQRLLDIPPGPRVGSALAVVTAAQIDGLVQSRDEALAYLLRHAGPAISDRSS
jgi:Poly A polymerase head domain/Probable RNA and SrmB- binding site of polymerase A